MSEMLRLLDLREDKEEETPRASSHGWERTGACNGRLVKMWLVEKVRVTQT